MIQKLVSAYQLPSMEYVKTPKKLQFHALQKSWAKPGARKHSSKPQLHIPIT